MAAHPRLFSRQFHNMLTMIFFRRQVQRCKSGFFDASCLVFVVLLCLFLVASWSPAVKRLTSWLSCLLCFVTFPNVSWSTSELRARLALWNWFKPSSVIFYWPFQGGNYFVNHLCYLRLVFAMRSRLFIAALWSHAGKGPTSWLLFVMSHCDFVTFPCGILGQVWYLIVLIPDFLQSFLFSSHLIFWIYNVFKVVKTMTKRQKQWRKASHHSLSFLSYTSVKSSLRSTWLSSGTRNKRKIREV